MMPKKYHGPRSREKHAYDSASDRVDKMTLAQRQERLKVLETLRAGAGITEPEHHELRALKAALGRRQ